MNLKDICAICRVPMTRHAVIRLLPCRHLLHRKCGEHLQNDQEAFCPICRAITNETEPIERKHYTKHINQDRERIVTCANRGDDWVALAVTLDVNYKTAYHWVHSGRDVMLQKGGIKPKILTEEQIEVMVSWVEEDCDIYLKQLQAKILQNFRKVVSITTIGNYLEGRLFTIKQKHSEPATMNTEENKRKRAEYVQALNQYIEQGKQIVWIDETNFNLFCRRTRGRSRVGSRAIQHLPAARGPNVHLIGAISTAGVVTMDRRRGSFTAISANVWATSLLQHWEEIGNRLGDLVIVCDNAPCHARLEEFTNGTTATLLRLGPYSPMLNPIETIWSKVKCYVKTRLRVPQVVAPGVIDQRLAYLEEIIDAAKDTIIGGDCARAAQHTTIHHAAALARGDMMVGR